MSHDNYIDAIHRHYADSSKNFLNFCLNQRDATGLISGGHFDQKVDFLDKLIHLVDQN